MKLRRSWKGYYPHLIDYRDWEDATPEQRRAWNCALDLALDMPMNKESGPKAAPVVPDFIIG